MELTDRKKQILKIVVESYINTAEPVGSKAIVEQMPGKISSATIRNELADLVEMGYLEQPHTSAGRVPSAKGYRLYVNELMERKALSPEETAKINDALSGQMKQVDQVISQAGQMVSSFVGYPTYAVADHRPVAPVQRFELISVSESSFIAVVLLIGAEIFGGQPVTVQGVTLCLLNAVIVALAANGMYDAAAKGKKTESYQHEE